jgi:hypothetical protein
MTRRMTLMALAGLAVRAELPAVDGIYLHFALQMGVGGAMFPTYVPYIFLKNGMATSDLSTPPPTDLTADAWRAQKPKSWGRWRKVGDTIEIDWEDSKRTTSVWKKWFVARPARPNEMLSGRYQSLTGGGNAAMGGETMTAAWRGYEFQPNGSVLRSGGAATSTRNDQGSVVANSRRTPQSGRYRTDGYTIEFTFADETRRYWFYVYPDNDRVLGIGSSTFTKKN